MQENTENFENNSGQGAGTLIPKEVKKFNWGAFLLGWIWGIFNKSFITLLIFVCPLLFIIFKYVMGLPVPKELFRLFAFAFAIWFGIKGNEWAWQNKRWNSLKHFHDVQRKWAIAGAILYSLLFVLLFLGIIAALTVPTLMNNVNNVEDKAFVKKSLTYAYQAFLLPNENRCELSSTGLAACAGERISRPANDNKIIMSDDNNSYLEFTGDGNCSNYDACYIRVVAPNVDERIGLHLDENGNVLLNKEDTHNILEKYRK